MSLDDIVLPPDVLAARSALWLPVRDAGIVIGRFKPPAGRQQRGFTENVLLGTAMCTLDAVYPLGRPHELHVSVTLVDTAVRPPRADGLGLGYLRYEGGVWLLHLERSESMFLWNAVYAKLTGGILAQESMAEVRMPDVLVVASHIGRFLADGAA